MHLTINQPAVVPASSCICSLDMHDYLNQLYLQISNFPKQVDATMLAYGALAAVGGVVLYANLPTRLTLGHVVPSVDYLSKAKLIPIITDENHIDERIAVLASSLFDKGPTMVMAVRRPGCMFCRKEAAALSSLEPEAKAAGIEMVAVVHETKGVNEFMPYFKGDVYYDKERHFYGPNQRWLPLWMGFLRIKTYWNAYKTKKAGFVGNSDGEGRLLGGVYLVVNNELVYSHLEREWGDAANIDEIRDAIRKLK
ncbi:Glutaredoxin [Trichostrongylus colubriformis]|uniref:Peroxiredoxin-like 2A n=1 Tax=Trichostrongylus colubriformis TaxID=6319 RepID=A0AAN8G6F6_TRICO